MTGSPEKINRWAANSLALVVGIDRYDLADVPALTGATADAVAAVNWLRTLGVPDAQILLNVSPSPTSKAALDALRIHVEDATFSKIWGSIYRLHQVPDGTRLFIFLSGHGLYDAADGRLFLTQEYAVNGNFTANRERFGLPTIQGVVVLADLGNGTPLAIMDSIEITIQRTGAATAVAAKYLTRDDPLVVRCA